MPASSVQGVVPGVALRVHQVSVAEVGIDI